MSWQLAPPTEIEEEIDKLGLFEFNKLAGEVETWISEDDYDDIALARGIMEKGYSEEFAWWALKEVRMRIADHA